MGIRISGGCSGDKDCACLALICGSFSFSPGEWGYADAEPVAGRGNPLVLFVRL
jgi:hypothetical protein